ncbi:MAG TPA: response regulator [Bryobacteraceae bacterium]|nr:response regulator [Bryobacteraceae bacterium]
MHRRTILLVEDNRDDELLTLDALRNGGVANQVTVVRDGAGALDYLFAQGSCAGRDTSRQPCVILLDLKLPKVGGMEVLRRIKTDERTKRIPVVVLTTSSEHEDIHNCYGNGANSYVRKPVEFDRFLEAVRRLGLYWTLVNERTA